MATAMGRYEDCNPMSASITRHRRWFLCCVAIIAETSWEETQSSPRRNVLTRHYSLILRTNWNGPEGTVTMA